MAPNTEPNVGQDLNPSTPAAGSTPPPTAPNTSSPTTPAGNPVQPTTTNPDYAFPAAGSAESLVDESANAPAVSSETPITSNDAVSEPQQNIDPLAMASPVATAPGYVPDGKPKPKKLLKILVPVLIVVILLVAGGFFYIKTQRTSAATLKEFSSATSQLSSESSSLTSQISTSFTRGSSDSLDEDVKAFDDALANLESKSANIKSDKKALKVAAENYVKELKSYRETSIMLAIDASKVSAIGSKLATVMNTSSATSASTPAEYADKITALITEIDKHNDELKALDLTNSTAKEYRDSSVQLVEQVKEIFSSLRTSILNGDSSAALDAQTKLIKLSSTSDAITREKDIENALSVDSDASKKVEAARDALNDEINKVNKSR